MRGYAQKSRRLHNQHRKRLLGLELHRRHIQGQQWGQQQRDLQSVHPKSVRGGPDFEPVHCRGRRYVPELRAIISAQRHALHGQPVVLAADVHRWLLQHILHLKRRAVRALPRWHILRKGLPARVRRWRHDVRQWVILCLLIFGHNHIIWTNPSIFGVEQEAVEI